MALMQIIVFAAIAGFVLIKLYNVLGKDVGAPPPASAQRSTSKTGNVGTPAQTMLRPAFTGPAAAGLEAIHAADGRFDPKTFLEGARTAYEYIVEAYSKGDLKTLKNLLQQDVYARYAEAIAAREKENKALETEIIKINSSEIKEATMENKTARIVVLFSAELSTREQEVDKPEEAKVQRSATTEEWTFVRNINARNPNWKLASVATLA